MQATVLLGVFSMASVVTFIIELQRQLCVVAPFPYVGCAYNGSLAAFSVISAIFGVRLGPGVLGHNRVNWSGEG